MNKLTRWIALTVVAAVAVLAAGWVLLVTPKRSEAADLRQQASTQSASNEQLRIQLSMLKAQAKELPKEQAKLAAVAAKLPDNPAQPELLRALAAAADGAGVALVSVSPAALTPVVAATPAAPSADATAGPAVAAKVAAASTLMAMPLTLVVAGDYFQVEQFVAAIENLPRAMRITNLALAAGAAAGAAPATAGTPVSLDDGKHLLTTITGTVFVAAGSIPTVVSAAPPAAAMPAVTAPKAPVAAPAN